MHHPMEKLDLQAEAVRYLLEKHFWSSGGLGPRSFLHAIFFIAVIGTFKKTQGPWARSQDVYHTNQEVLVTSVNAYYGTREKHRRVVVGRVSKETKLVQCRNPGARFYQQGIERKNVKAICTWFEDDSRIEGMRKALMFPGFDFPALRTVRGAIEDCRNELAAQSTAQLRFDLNLSLGLKALMAVGCYINVIFVETYFASPSGRGSGFFECVFKRKN